jgi:prepilin-type N-terminal cleavage/methylation domain-containing protein/prepilin-type processing-associated H-X9-DG protein
MTGQRARNHPRRCSAFTIIEVLVVVAIIATLVAVLVSSLSRARMQARSAQCLSNLKQICGSLQQYSVENNEILPRGCTPDGGPNWTAAAARSMGLVKTTLAWSAMSQLQVGSMPILHCPERVRTLDSPYLDYVGNAMDPEGPRDVCVKPGQPDPTGEWRRVCHWIGAHQALCRVRAYKQPGEVVYVIDAEKESRNITFGNSVSLEQTRRNPVPNMGVGAMDVYQGLHLPQGKPPHNVSDQPGPRRVGRELHMERYTNAAFMDGHAAPLTLVERTLANGQPDDVAQYAYWLRMFGVRDAATIAAADPDMW